MSLRPSTSSSAGLRVSTTPVASAVRVASVAMLLVLATPSLARAQACCAGGSAITPGRLEAHETALVGVELRAASVLGSYDSGGHYAGSPSGDTEFDLEQDIFGAVRVLGGGRGRLNRHPSIRLHRGGRVAVRPRRRAPGGRRAPHGHGARVRDG